MRRREFITLLGGMAAAWPLEARAQPSGKTRQIGFLGGASQAETGRRLDAMRTGLRQLGYEEGRTSSSTIDGPTADTTASPPSPPSW
jgi:putative ABC transport system substrate-binding protein